MWTRSRSSLVKLLMGNSVNGTPVRDNAVRNFRKNNISAMRVGTCSCRIPTGNGVDTVLIGKILIGKFLSRNLVSGDSLRLSPVIIMLAGLVAIAMTACTGSNPTASPTPSANPTTAVPASAPVASAPSPSASPSPVVDGAKVYQEALNKAEAATSISQSAQSKDDWLLVAKRWQEAIALLKTIPTTAPEQVQAKAKLTEYERNFKAATQASGKVQRSRPTTTVSMPEVASAPESEPASVTPAATTTPQPTATPMATKPSSVKAPGVFEVPIKRRDSGTPVIEVLFNGSQRFEMIVDTGASGTVITQEMARALGVVTIGEARVNTASERGVRVPIGIIKSMQVSGAIAMDVPVAIGNSALDVGLLGHDFFGDYDMVLKSNTIEFRHR